MTKRRIHIGTSGWVYSHWRGVFYPEKLAQRSWLEYYVQHFDCTEINGSFYRLPSKETVIRWQETAGRGFYFCPKISRFITHAKKLNDPGQTVPRFFEVFDVMAGRAGPVLIQLPAMLGFNEEKVSIFFQYLRHHYRGFRFSVEARHPAWMEPAAIALLEKYRIGWVMADSGTRFPSGNAITAKHIYLRFHGPDGSYGTGYTKKSLAVQAARCREWSAAGHTVWIFFNNDVGGHAIRNALSLKAMVDE
jgi:uncharacterized protein YecE (DUF72 family)